MNPEAILKAAGNEAENLGSMLYVVYPRGTEPTPSNLKVIPEAEFTLEKYSFYSMVNPLDKPTQPVVQNKTQVGIMAFNKTTMRPRVGTKGGASGHLYKTLPQAQAAVGRRNKVEDYLFLPAFVEMPE